MFRDTSFPLKALAPFPLLTLLHLRHLVLLGVVLSVLLPLSARVEYSPAAQSPSLNCHSLQAAF